GIEQAHPWKGPFVPEDRNVKFAEDSLQVASAMFELADRILECCDVAAMAVRIGRLNVGFATIFKSSCDRQRAARQIPYRAARVDVITRDLTSVIQEYGADHPRVVVEDFIRTVVEQLIGEGVKKYTLFPR